MTEYDAEYEAVADEQIWTRVQDELRFQLSRPSYEAWVKKTRLVSQIEDCFLVGVPSKLAKDWLEDRFAGVIQETLQAVTGRDVDLRFVVANSDAPADGPGSLDEPADQVELSDEGPLPDLNPKFSFKTFVVGNNSRFAHAACHAVADSPAINYNPLFLYGGVGLGKTHLMHPIGHEVHAKFPQKRVMYLTSEQFLNELVASIQSAKMHEFRNKYRTVDVLLIDDIQFIAGKDRTKEEFFHTFNALYEINKQIVISSDRPPKEIPTLEDRLRSRFESGLIADIQPPDFETRLAILKSKLGPSNGLVTEEVITLIAHKVQKNIRELEGALTRVLAYAAIHQSPIDVEQAANLLADIIPSVGRKPLTVARVQEVVSEFYGITVAEMVSKRRDRNIVLPRQVAMYIVREDTPSSLPAIGLAFGGRDHTTALHSWDKICGEIQEDSVLRAQVETIRARLASE